MNVGILVGLEIDSLNFAPEFKVDVKEILYNIYKPIWNIGGTSQNIRCFPFSHTTFWLQNLHFQFKNTNLFGFKNIVGILYFKKY